jgi:hypothetical protein
VLWMRKGVNSVKVSELETDNLVGDSKGLHFCTNAARTFSSCANSLQVEIAKPKPEDLNVEMSCAP